MVFLAGWTGFLLYGLEHITLLASRLDPWLRLLQVVGVIGLAGTLLVVYNGFRTWTVPGRSWWTRLHDTAMALSLPWLRLADVGLQPTSPEPYVLSPKKLGRELRMNRLNRTWGEKPLPRKRLL